MPVQTQSSESTQQQTIAKRLQETAAALSQLALSAYPDSIRAAARLIAEAFGKGNKLLVFGNGGSAADAQHICGEFVVRFQRQRKALPAISLSCDSAVITACGNDFSFQDIFSRQIEALGKPGDVALGLSTSGTSPNVVKAFETARGLGLTTILMTGARGADLRFTCDLVLAAPGVNTARIQEMHLISYHLICELVEDHVSQEATC